MVDFREFELAEHVRPFEANRILFKWLSDDADRAALYRYLSIHRPLLKFQSRADTKAAQERDNTSVFQQSVYLLSKREHVVCALTDTERFSNAPYRELGSGTFMLALDGGDHQPQRDFAAAYLKSLQAPTIAALAEVAFLAAAALPLKQRQFDLAELAEQTALRFMGFLFGYAQKDHTLLESSMRAAYLGLNYQILGRHFVTEPGIMPEAERGMGALLQRTAALLDLYCEQIGRAQKDAIEAIDLELKEIRAYKNRSGRRPLEDFVPLLRRIAGQAGPNAASNYSGTELAVVIVGLIAGTIGNVQASVAIAIREFFHDSAAFARAHEAAGKSRLGGAGAHQLGALIWEALRLNPPVAFLPRKTLCNVDFDQGSIPAGTTVILAIGGATLEPSGHSTQFLAARAYHDTLIFGGAPDETGYAHQCIGQHLAMPLITHIVRQVLLLPGLAERLDPASGEPLGLEKLWGFNCSSYPLEFNRFEILRQSPLNVVMQIKKPLSVHAEELKKIIKYGAPRIEKKLHDARHVHFAWFEFIENDTKLVLHTVYDRDFDAYIEHFALEIGPLFDLLFEHIEDAPPLPVRKFPKEFVDTIRRHDVPPAGGYFFSAYARLEVAMIANQYREEGE
jgi:cytochrome P450